MNGVATLLRSTALAATTVAAGCLTTDPLPNPSRAPVAAEIAERVPVLRTALIDRPAGDDYLSRGLWAEATRPVPHELSALLARNGLRAGVLTGVPTREMTALLNDPNALIDPADRAVVPGQSQLIPVAGPLDRCTVTTVSAIAADPATTAFDQAECAFAVTATPLKGGRLKLECQPRFQHGEPRAWILPTATASFTRQERKSQESLDYLTFTVSLDPGETLVIGPTDHPVETLGAAFFIDAAPDRVRQRVLVVQLKP